MELKKVEQWVSEARDAMESAELYFGHGTDNAWDEACWMVSHVLNLEADFGPEVFSEALSADNSSALDSLLAGRIQTKKPLAYLLGHAWFAGLPFKVTEDVLVPRSPMAELILNNLSPWFDLHHAKRGLDVGTGSGCIACALAHHWRKLKVDAVDLSMDALAIAQHNVDALGLADRVRVCHSDLFSSLKGECYDVILANPPYVPESSMAALPAEYHHEPSLGLVAGPEGLDVVTRLMVQAADHLTPKGVLVVEVGEAWPFFDRWAQARRLEITWLEFEHGGEGVFLTTRSSLAALVDHPI